MKQESEYAVYGEDTDHSERKLCHVFAKSVGHAKDKVRKMGYKKVTDAVRV